MAKTTTEQPTQLQLDIIAASTDTETKRLNFQKLKDDFENLKPGINTAKSDYESALSNLELLTRQQNALTNGK